ncbi:ELMO domain-containing protein 3 [Alosa sapidissima]|uniref:ELMO domain-containing protein 3 n=1 Tax=Alosa sapidissima TaxID=34773 RepID=UPI001C088A55|nr:ELMO domain-containing protein 3 [Alosa sapidissima]XP_041955622.1 ELMO domain-containing protein 3 [Alosa sapidissima]XP_041955623.1 ELMO domain-containing protein 3 [Alosa sapidissima]XP_041955624.1 ELMO domain-containing protein 3 [Alosa sapidissima]XP_041955625.1 ELMO domain-containing protein 3 [Alosa sapidissima]XP_041955626.1 ELMO domain-containing protein 3 [Alosa sapidissima]XP_041955627.1 ELMO domain-containing protein 3 [Alosa sapidissima]
MEGDIILAANTEGLNGLPQECKQTVDLTNGHSNHKPEMNGVAPGHAIIKEHANGNSLHKPVPISALKQNGLLQSLAAGGDQPRTEEVNSEVERAREEWDALESIQPVLPEELAPSPLISFNEALQHFQTTDLADLLKNIQPTIRRTGLAAITHFLFGPPRLHKELLEERDLVFAIAQCSLDNGQPVHMRVLQTIYRKLTGNRNDCPRFGPHWENVGFQGTDPSTDLRGTGFLGLMHTLYLVMDPETLPLARDIYKLSQHPVQNFPFSVMSINMTRIALHALREEVLSKECNRRQQVVGVINDFYAATFLHLFQLWKSEQKTISDSGYVLKEVEIFAKKNPKQILRRLETFLKERRTRIGHRASPDSLSHSNRSPSDRGSSLETQGTKEGKEMNFTGVCELPAEMEGEARLI